ncbi:MAG: histidine phosphatase family protein [Acidobacteria bacterium]|nr:MAG: histidine phosphatase family protein [Acidobacteriota bacterium]PYY18103.1 MAG: histidine phosphatase family protein [Acidobacteriota bacterium]
MSEPKQEIWLMRHGETEWSASGAHTSRTDLPLLPSGIKQAEELKTKLKGRKFALVLVSPMQRARETCRLAGYADKAEITDDLKEWDYGLYEGRSTAQIRQDRPNWSLWRDGVLEGEPIENVGRRVKRIIDRCNASEGDVAIFAHGHVLRILTAVWLDLPPADGKLFALNTATISVLGYEHEYKVIRHWNCPGV